MRRTHESGMALLSVMLVMMLMSAMLLGFFALVSSDQQSSGANRDQTQAYAAAHAGLEKLTADLGAVFTAGNYSPTVAQLNGLEGTPPALPGFQYLSPDGGPGYIITWQGEENGQPPSPIDPNGTPITNGPYQGLVGLITPYDITVTARTEGVAARFAEVRMRRQMQTIAVPVFQFGLFSENDLSFHAGDDFSFGGRVHTNSNLFLASASGATLTIADKITVVGDLVRTHFANGRSAASYSGPVRIAKAPGCPSAPTPANGSCRNLAANEGSLVGMLGSADNPTWTNTVLAYNTYLRNGDMGARRLDLPLVSDGATPIDLIRRPPAGIAEPAPLAAQRFFNMATLRILLSDTAAELTSLPGVVGSPVSLEAASVAGYPLATSNGQAKEGYRSASGTPLIGGFILINRQSSAGVWTDVTNEILQLGISGRNLGNNTWTATIGTCNTEPQPNAILRLQRIRDVPVTPSGGLSPAYCNLSVNGTDYWPNVLYDAREGLRRDNESTSQNELYLGGLMHYLEFDVNNFRRWIEGTLGTSGPGSQDLTGYVVYFSDRRGNKNAANQETGEYGWEDFINSDSVSTPNGVLNTGEDMNANGLLDTYGNIPRIGYTVVAPNSVAPWGTGSPINNTVNVYGSRVNKGVARANRAVFFRRALKLVNGGLGSLPSVNLQGLTIASENPVYVQGNFNACGTPTQSCGSGGFGPTGDAHRSAAIIADSVTLLSRNWNDIRSFNTPHAISGRPAATTWYRMAVITGKGINFPFPNNNAGDPANFGSDGGAHNFMRFVENWSNGSTINYRGSMVSLFFSRQGVGTWKCCENVYAPPDRGTNFDVEFLSPNLLPPRTPMFRDVNTLTFRQLLRPTQ